MGPGFRPFVSELFTYHKIRQLFIQGISNYRPPKKFREGNDFTRVCLFTGGGPYVTISHDALELTVQGPLLVTSGGLRWRPVQTCSFGDPPGVTSGGGHIRFPDGQ